MRIYGPKGEVIEYTPNATLKVAPLDADGEPRLAFAKELETSLTVTFPAEADDQQVIALRAPGSVSWQVTNMDPEVMRTIMGWDRLWVPPHDDT